MDKPATTWRYDLHSIDSEGGATIVLTSDGCFMSVNDFQNVAIRWKRLAEGRDFRIVLLELSPEQALAKLFPKKEYDPVATLSAVQGEIDDLDEDEPLLKRNEQDLLEEHDNLGDADAFLLWCADTNLTDPHEFSRKRYPTMARAFVEKTLPRLVEAIKVEFDAEKSVKERDHG